VDSREARTADIHEARAKEYTVAKLWVGVDIGKTDHHLVAVNADGQILYSARVPNDETALRTAIGEIEAAGQPVCWAVDITTGLAALLLTLLWERRNEVRYVSGTVAFHMAAAFAGENKTDARDAAVIAHTIRMRPDVPVLQPTDRLLAELAVLTSYRADLVRHRVACQARLQTLLVGISPALENAVERPVLGRRPTSWSRWISEAASRHDCPHACWAGFPATASTSWLTRSPSPSSATPAAATRSPSKATSGCRALCGAPADSGRLIGSSW
jgi:hypothetical protein